MCFVSWKALYKWKLLLPSGKKQQAIVIIIRLNKHLSSSYCGQIMIKIREILLLIPEHNAIKFLGRDSTFPASFCYKPAGEMI